MDKETLSHYGWIVVLVMILAVLLAFATPFGTFVADGFKATYAGFDMVGNGAMNNILDVTGLSDKLECGHKPNDPGDHNKKDCGHYNCDEDCNCVPGLCGVPGHYEGDGMDHSIKTNHYNYIDSEQHHHTCQCYEWEVPEGGTYIASNGNTYVEGEMVPCSSLRTGDVYLHGDYKYTAANYSGNWAISLNNDIIDKTQTHYGEIIDYYINYAPITSAYALFSGCYNLIESPAIPSTVTNLNITYQLCYALEIPPDLSQNTVISTFYCAFNGCKSLKQPIKLACTAMGEHLGGLNGAQVEYVHVNGCDEIKHCQHQGGTANCYNKAICTICNTEYGDYKHTLSEKSICTICGEAKVILETDHYYKNGQNIVLGTWDYSDAKSVNITIHYQTASTAYDWCSITEGIDYIAGDTNSTRNYLTTNGTIKAIQGRDSSVKFGGRTYGCVTFENVEMLTGSVYFRSDSAENRWGIKVIITPNY